ncbi:MAG TPA: hypothetical protein VFI70_11360 [Nitrososphaeraceae archaeon]|nr:hypothetical protein [Nitrososphaeraceae archaeon]
MTTAKQQQRQQIDWRRSQVLELTSKGYSQSDIARVLQIDKSVICRDITALNQQSQENIKKYVDEKLPNEYEKCLIGLTAILRESWDMSQQPDIDRREKIQALSLAKECYTTKLELLTNATVVDDAIRFVAAHTQKNQHKDSNDKLIKEMRNEDIEKEITPATTESSTSNSTF